MRPKYIHLTQDHRLNSSVCIIFSYCAKCGQRVAPDPAHKSAEVWVTSGPTERQRRPTYFLARLFLVQQTAVHPVRSHLVSCVNKQQNGRVSSWTLSSSPTTTSQPAPLLTRFPFKVRIITNTYQSQHPCYFPVSHPSLSSPTSLSSA